MQPNAKKVLLEWEDDVIKSLLEGFRQLFESSSEVLLEFADAAENNRLQRLFFDAQREFYLKEETIIGEFEAGLRQHLLTSTPGVSRAAQPGSDTLSLVEKEDYERSLALETIGKRVLNRQQPALHALAQRLSALLGGRPISIDQVPGNPLQIVGLFDPASRKLEVEKEVRLVFYTLFDRFVMSRLSDLYQVFNDRLVALGILPNIKYDYQRFGLIPPPSGSAAADDALADGNAAIPEAAAANGAATAASLRPKTPTSAETLSAISSLLMEKRRQQAAVPLETAHPIPVGVAANVGEAIVDHRVLDEAPHPLPFEPGPVKSKVAVDPALLMKVKTALEKQRQIIKHLVGRENLDRREEDVIDIVGMLFEAMLNEELLPNAVKTLLSHLHTRYLKIAVQSTDFLDNTAHPARRLFERMLDAGIRWVREDNLRAGIYPTLQALVSEILDHETLEDNFFEQKIEQLDVAEKKLEQMTNAAEERTLEAERGRARLERAKATVRESVSEIIGDNRVGPTVHGFMETTFTDYLTLLLLRSDLDKESDAWNNAYSVGEALIAAAVYTAAGKPLGQEFKDDLTQRLQSTVASLIPHHEQNIRRVIDALGEASEITGKPPPAAETPVPQEKQAAATPVTDADQKVVAKLMREAGNWFVWRDKGGKVERTVKLLWVNPHTRNMLFVDQHGAKVSLTPATTVAAMIRDGSVRPLQQETSSFVARSLRRIRRALEDSVNL